MQGLCIGLDESMSHYDGSSANKMSHESFAACLFRVIVVAFSTVVNAMQPTKPRVAKGVSIRNGCR